jgi:phosphoglycolate phosphatase-like HAD superfamily hydrolase
MNERANNAEENPKYIRKSFTSNLERADNSFESFSIKLDSNNKPPLVVFEDIDKTLLHLEPTYTEIRKIMWGDAVKQDGIEEVSKVHLDGFRLGTMWRELYRMHAIYKLGKLEWKDAQLYEEEFLAPGMEGEHIDEPGDKLHEECNIYLNNFDDIAALTVEKQAKENPNFFDESKIKSMYKLNTLYKRAGVVIVGMTANPKKFANALCKYAGLGEYFIDCATDTDVPGTKEYKMLWLISKLEKIGIQIPYDKLLVIGDSPLGDAGSAERLAILLKEKFPEFKASGIVIIQNKEEGIIAQEKLKNTTHIKKSTFNIDNVPLDKDGVPDLVSKNRKTFYTDLN